MFRIFKVTGQSMAPTINDGSYVLCSHWPKTRLRVNDLIVIDHPEHARIVKRIVNINSTGNLKIAGDNPRSTQFNDWFSPASVIGKVIMQFPKK